MSRFRYSLNSSTIQTTPILQKIAVAGKAGYAGIELWHNDIDAYIAQGGALSDTRKALDDYDLEVPSTIHLKQWFQTEGQEYLAVMDSTKTKLEQAAAVGAQYIVAGPPAGPANRELGGRRYAALVDLGRQFGVRPAFEYLGFVDDIRTIEDALDVIHRSRHPDAAVVLDPFHCFSGGGTIESISQIHGSLVAVSHFNDAPASPPARQLRDPDRVFPGDGVIDLRRYCDLLSNIGYRGFLSLELFRQDLWQRNPLDVALEGLEKMRRIAES